MPEGVGWRREEEEGASEVEAGEEEAEEGVGGSAEVMYRERER